MDNGGYQGGKGQGLAARSARGCPILLTQEQTHNLSLLRFRRGKRWVCAGSSWAAPLPALFHHCCGVRGPRLVHLSIVSHPSVLSSAVEMWGGCWCPAERVMLLKERGEPQRPPCSRWCGHRGASWGWGRGSAAQSCVPGDRTGSSLCWRSSSGFSSGAASARGTERDFPELGGDTWSMREGLDPPLLRMSPNHRAVEVPWCRFCVLTGPKSPWDRD